MPKVSIITINYNNVDGLRKTIDSVVSQSCPDYEWIVIDGGSTDGSKELIEENANYFGYWTSEPDNGIYNAMNKGLNHASGDYVHFLNSGDYYPDKEVLNDFSHSYPLQDVIYGNTYLVDNNKNVLGAITPPDSISMLYFFNNNLNHQSIFFKRACFNHFRFNEKYMICADRDIILKLLFNGYSYYHWDRVVACYDSTGISTRESDRMQAESVQCMNEILPTVISTDYANFVKIRDVDIAQIALRIINSNKVIRYLARLVLYPFKMFV